MGGWEAELLLLLLVSVTPEFLQYSTTLSTGVFWSCTYTLDATFYQLSVCLMGFETDHNITQAK